MWENWVQSLDWEDPLEKEMATHASILAWRTPWTEEPGGLQSTGWQRVRHDWVTSLSLSFTTLVIAFFSRRKHLLISWLQSPSAVIFEPKKRKSVTVSIVSSSMCCEVMCLDAMILIFWMLNFKPAFSPSSVPGIFQARILWVGCHFFLQGIFSTHGLNPLLPGFPVLHYLPEFVQTSIHWVSDAMPPSHPLSSPSPPALSLSQYQGCLWFHINFRSIFSKSVKSTAGMLIQIVLNL